MNKTLSISPFSLSPNISKNHKRFSSYLNQKSSNTLEYDPHFPSEKEINSLKEKIKKYLYDYGLLISELNFWKKILDKKLTSFFKNIQNFIDNDDIKFVENYNRNNSDYKDNVRMKKIYDDIFVRNEKNNKNIYKPLFNDEDFSLSKNILNELISSNNDIINTNKFIDCTSKVLKYVIEFNNKFKNLSKSEINNESKNKSNMNKNSISLLSQNILENEVNKSNYSNKKIIEKYIDFRDYNNQRNKNIALSSKPFYTNITPKSINYNSIVNLKKNIGNNIESLKTCQSSGNIWLTPKRSYQHNNIYSRKSATPIISESFCKNFQFENKNKKNETVSLILNSTKTIEGNRYLNKCSSMKNNLLFNKNLKFIDLSSTKRNNSKFKNKFDSEEKINLNDRIFHLKSNHLFSGKEKEQKTFIHKKMMVSNNRPNNLKKNIEKLNFKNHIRSNSNLVQSNNSKILDFQNINNYTNAPFINNKSIITLNNATKNNDIRSSLFKMNNKNNIIQKTIDENEKNKKGNDNINENSHNLSIIKTKFDEQIIIDSDFPLYLGLDLGETDCKFSFSNGTNNEIKLISFKKDIYSIPTLIYFNEKNEEIKIGQEAESNGIKQSSQIVFNLLKYLGVNYNEIIGKKELLPFKIYKDNNNRPYIKLNYNGQKDKLFYFEDILSLFLQKLFQYLFKKIMLKNKNNLNINLYMELSLPNYLSYLQRKIIEKIIINQIFPKHAKYNGYNINLTKLNIENSANIACLNEISKLKNEFEYKNSLVIFTDRCSINLSIINQNRKKYEVKAIENAAFGEEDLIDNYLYYCIRRLDKIENNNIIKSPEFLYRLRKGISSAKKNFDIMTQTQISIEINNSSLDIILTRDDYERSCDEFFKKITMLIKNIIDKSKLLKLDIDNIILIGQTSNSLKMKKILLDIFQENKKIYEKIICNLFNKNIDNEYLVSIGCVYQALNKNNLLLQNYIFIDICPSSFGVESFDGTMAIIIQKGEKLPSKNKKLVKLNNKQDNIYINIFEGEDRFVKNNKFIISACLDKTNFRKHIGKDFIEVYIQLEIDCDNNLKCFIYEPFSKSMFECLININVVKN